MKEISIYLGISPRTVECYINNMKAKLDCHCKSQLLNYAESLAFIDSSLYLRD